MLIGDLNEIASSDENFGGKNFGSTSRKYLENFITDTGLIDIGFIGNIFTWRNKREGLGHIRQRLDRALANETWKLMFPNETLTHLPASNSDHNPILLTLLKENQNKPYPFKFLSAWTRDPTSKNVVKNAWSKQLTGSFAFKFSKRIKITKSALRQWNKTHFKNCEVKIQEIMNEIEIAQNKEPSQENIKHERNLQL